MRSTAAGSAASGGLEGAVYERMGCLMKRRAWSPGCGAVAVSFSSDPWDWAWVGVALLVLVGMGAAVVFGIRRRR